MFNILKDGKYKGRKKLIKICVYILSSFLYLNYFNINIYLSILLFQVENDKIENLNYKLFLCNVISFVKIIILI